LVNGELSRGTLFEDRIDPAEKQLTRALAKNRMDLALQAIYDFF
jgi:hypothetical protein